jgi:hypothetical protein
MYYPYAASERKVHTALYTGSQLHKYMYHIVCTYSQKTHFVNKETLSRQSATSSTLDSEQCVHSIHLQTLLQVSLYSYVLVTLLHQPTPLLVAL